MYLSRIIINPACRRARRDLSNLYEMHRTVMSAFPDSHRERVLFRVDMKRFGPCPVLYVQSEVEADWRALVAVDAYLADPPDARGNPAQRFFDPEFRAGDRFIFRLRANPTVKRNGKRHALYTEAEQMRWLERKVTTAGGRLLGARVSAGQLHRFRDNDGRRVTLFGVTFDGLLEVTSADLLKTAVAEGIGAGKGFGFGLLSLARGGR